MCAGDLSFKGPREYLSYGKPVISSWTAGLASEYRGVLEVFEDETPECLARRISEVLEWPQARRAQYEQQSRAFLAGRLWWRRAERLVAWLNACVV